MRTIGLLGGMSWQSSALYYRVVNEAVRERLGGTSSARCLLWSANFAEVEALQEAGDWTGAARLLADAARRLEGAGADLLVLCTNTMHEVADAIEAAVDVPLLHIADVAAGAVRRDGLDTVGLLGTAFTMERDAYLATLRERHGLEVFVPEAADRTDVHRIIYDELVRGVVRDESRRRYREVIEGLVARGAQGVLLACTEIELLVGPEDAAVPLYETARLHALAAVDAALAQD